MDWLKARWAESESRVAMAVMPVLVGLQASGKIDRSTLAMALGGAILAFVFPSQGAAP